jgi:hypothetical protein
MRAESLVDPKSPVPHQRRFRLYAASASQRPGASCWCLLGRADEDSVFTEAEGVQVIALDSIILLRC